jgi:NADPH2:quinone reductase
MKHQRVVVDRYGGPEVLQVVDEDVPEPKAGEVRVRVLAAGVAMPDVMAREGIHPETPGVPYTPGWDLVGVVDRLGAGVSEFDPGQVVTAMPISGAYAGYVCLDEEELVAVPPGLDPAAAVSLVLNYITARQMLHHSAKARSGQRILIHGASGGVGTALLHLGGLLGLTMVGTCSPRGFQAVADLGGTPIDYRRDDLVQEVLRRAPGGMDAVFDPFGGTHMWHSRRVPSGRWEGRRLRHDHDPARRGAGFEAPRSSQTPFIGCRRSGCTSPGGCSSPEENESFRTASNG